MDEFVNQPHKFNPYNENYDQNMVWQYFRQRPQDLPEWRRRYVPANSAYYCDQCMVLRQDCGGGDVCQSCRTNYFLCTRHDAAYNPMPYFQLYGHVPGQPPPVPPDNLLQQYINSQPVPTSPISMNTSASPPSNPAQGGSLQQPSGSQGQLPSGGVPSPGHQGQSPGGAPSPGNQGQSSGGASASPPAQSPPQQLVEQNPAFIDIHGGVVDNTVPHWNSRPYPWPLPIPDGMPVVIGDGSDEDWDSDSDEGQAGTSQKRGGRGGGRGRGRGGRGGKGGRGGTPHPKCETCLRRCRGRHRCNMDISSANPVGCTECSLWGLYCVYQGRALPPRQLTGDEYESKMGECEPCRRNERFCDRKRPCDSCVLHNEERCWGTSQANCFWRGAPGDNLPMYYYRLWCGVGGVHTKLPMGQPKPDLPPNYHLTYIPDEPGQDPARRVFPGMPPRAKEAQNPPPGPWKESVISMPMKAYDRNDFHPAADPPVLDVPDSLFANVPGLDPSQLNADLQLEYEKVWNDVVSLIRQGSNIIEANNIRTQLITDAVGGIYFHTSQLIADIQRFLLDRWSAARQYYTTAMTVALPPDAVANPAAVQKYNPGNPPIQNVTAEPSRRPPSPGPPIPTFGGDAGELVNVNVFNNSFPVGHPSRPDLTKLARPIVLHPNARPALANIPLVRMFTNGRLADQPIFSCLTQKNGQPCGKPAYCCCEDTTHVHGGFPICNDCEQESRNRFFDLITDSAHNLRAFCCAACCHDIPTNPGVLMGSGLRIWGLESGFPNGNPSVASREAPFTVRGGFMGERLGVTGCACATKLVERYICNPHRLQHSINLRLAQENVDIFAESVYGTKDICPACHRNPSIRAYNFQGVEGAQGLPVVWQCKGCHDIVVAPPGTQLNFIHDAPGSELLFSNPNHAQFSIFSGGGRMPSVGAADIISLSGSSGNNSISSGSPGQQQPPGGAWSPDNTYFQPGSAVSPQNGSTTEVPIDPALTTSSPPELQPHPPPQTPQRNSPEIPSSQEDIYGATPIRKVSPEATNPPPNQVVDLGTPPAVPFGGLDPTQGTPPGNLFGGKTPIPGNSPGYVNPQQLNQNSSQGGSTGGLTGGAGPAQGGVFGGPSPIQWNTPGAQNPQPNPDPRYGGLDPAQWQFMQALQASAGNPLPGGNPLPKGSQIPVISLTQHPFSQYGKNASWAPGQPGPGPTTNYQFPTTPSPPGVLPGQPVGGAPGGSGKTPSDGNMFGEMQPLDPSLFNNPPAATTTTSSPPHMPAGNTPPTDSPPPLPPGYTNDDYLEWMLRLS